jgi:hypothetical protein
MASSDSQDPSGPGEQAELHIEAAIARAQSVAMESRQLIGFLGRLLLQQHDGECVVKVDTDLPPFKFQYSMLAPGEMHVRVVDVVGNALAPHPAATAKIVVPKGR